MTASGRCQAFSVRVMKSPITSPSVVLTSSAAIASSGSISARRSEPWAVLWSVRAIRSRPSSRARATSSSRLVLLSCEKRECMWKSTFHSGGTGNYRFLKSGMTLASVRERIDSFIRTS